MKVETLTSATYFRDPRLPLRVWRVEDHFVAGLHRHEFHELVIITRGKGLHLTEQETYPITAGDVFLIHGDMCHGYDNLDHLDVINILFKPRLLGLPLADLGGLPGYQLLFHVEPKLRQQTHAPHRLRLRPDQLAEAVRLTDQLQAEIDEHPPGYRFAARAHLMQLITFLARSYRSSQHQPPDGLSRLGEVLSYLDRHYRENITVDQLTSVAHMSESTLIRAFHRVFQRSPIDYLIRLRIQRATALLADPELRITDIALNCGFNDSNYFTRQFRRVTGRSPRDYRRSLLRPSRDDNHLDAALPG